MTRSTNHEVLQELNEILKAEGVKSVTSAQAARLTLAAVIGLRRDLKSHIDDTDAHLPAIYKPKNIAIFAIAVVTLNSIANALGVPELIRIILGL